MSPAPSKYSIFYTHLHHRNKYTIANILIKIELEEGAG
jgi:hypothetical protein